MRPSSAASSAFILALLTTRADFKLARSGRSCSQQHANITVTPVSHHHHQCRIPCKRTQKPAVQVYTELVT